MKRGIISEGIIFGGIISEGIIFRGDNISGGIIIKMTPIGAEAYPAKWPKANLLAKRACLPSGA